ncbi:MAG: hypothetical protein DHS20C14_14930 [Phycisphaeraceae bacterium]|nr:MAG: hypothetical protein DHS20C14_14930 [Phycisphaeraceae bacterium]
MLGHRTSWALVGGALLVLGGCAETGSWLGNRPASQVRAGWRAPGPFEPVALRVFPLTRLDRDAEGQAQVVLHVELKDEWGDTVKGAGLLTVQLLRPQGERAGTGKDEVRWDVSLWSDEDNARHYDPSSRTYRIVLGEVPEWVVRMMPGADGSVAIEEGSVRLTAQLETPHSDGTMRRLWGESELRP